MSHDSRFGPKEEKQTPKIRTGVEGLETLIDYCVEVRDLARQWGVFNEGEKTGEVVFGFSKGGRVVGFELCD